MSENIATLGYRMLNGEIISINTPLPTVQICRNESTNSKISRVFLYELRPQIQELLLGGYIHCLFFNEQGEVVAMPNRKYEEKFGSDEDITDIFVGGHRTYSIDSTGIDLVITRN